MAEGGSAGASTGMLDRPLFGFDQPQGRLVTAVEVVVIDVQNLLARARQCSMYGSLARQPAKACMPQEKLEARTARGATVGSPCLQ